MAFQTNVFRDGEWVTETVNLHAVLRSQRAGPKGPTKPDPLKPPQCGLLTRTLVESARANSVLPVRLRSADRNDIAFVGDHFVQICELRKDGVLAEIARKNDFGCRIRNACVIGSCNIPELKDEAESDLPSFPAIKFENDQAGPFGFASPRPPGTSTQLPPQLLMVVLESGDNVLLFVRPGADGRHKFVATHLGSPQRGPAHLGFHTAVDPSSRYMALACPTDSFVVFELESHEQLNDRYLRNEPLLPVRSFRLRRVRGVIHKITFLYPRSGDDHHIILLLIIIRHGKSRTVIYEWELGDDLKVVFSEEKQGHRLPIEHQMPLLLVPMTMQSAFLAVYPDHVAVCTDCLHGPPTFDTRTPSAPPTPNHRGRQPPLWTAWARPLRLQSYRKDRDCVYLAREDGAVLFIVAEPEDLLAYTTFIDPFPCNISTAFACVFDHTTDVLVLGSDSGPGGYWKIFPRQPFQLLGILPNWSPVVDFTTTDDFTEWHQDAQKDKAMVPWQQAKHRKPDRIFATCEGGSKGSITEYRYGLKANIALDLEYGAVMKQAWLLRFCNLPTFDGYLLLLSLPDSTAGLLLSSDFSAATAPEPGMVPYDLSSPTLALVASGHLTIQITGHNVVLATEQDSRLFSLQDFPGLLGASVSDACALGNCLVVSAHTDSQFQLHVFKVDPYHLSMAQTQAIDVDGEITCLSLGIDDTVWVGVRKGSQTLLAHGSLQEPFDGLQVTDLAEYVPGQDGSVGPYEPSPVEGIDSIVSIRDTVLLGTRSGEVITVRKNAGSISVDCEKFGTMPASVSCSYSDGTTEPTILVCCDNNLISISIDQHGSRRDEAARLKTRSRVWPVDARNPESNPVPVQVAKAVDMPSQGGVIPILMVSGTRLLLAEMHEEPGPVHRSIPVEGSPNKILYCHFTQCLVAATNQPRGANLVFINPDTGEDIGRPTDKNGEPQAFIAGLGKEGDRVMALAEWNYRRANNVWNFILVATRSGRLIVVTTEKVGGRDGNPPAIRYWTRFRKEVKEPIYSVVGYDEGLIYCAGHTIQWEVLDPNERRLKPLKSFALSSPATSLRISHNKLVALTANDSLLVLDNHETAAEETKVRHVDPWRRHGIDFIEVAGPPPPPPTNHHHHPPSSSPSSSSSSKTTPNITVPSTSSSSIHLVADRDRAVAGLWVPWQTRDSECEVVLEAELPSSIRRFRRGRTRPLWEQRLRRPRFGRLAATADDAEVLGVALDGGLYQFTLLGVEAWRVLRFVQNLAGRGLPSSSSSSSLEGGKGDGQGDGHEEGEGEGEEGEDPEPKLAYGLEMHVDGDVLRRCYEERALERLVVRQRHVARFIELLGELDGAEHTRGLAAEGDHGRYFQLAYDMLEYYLAPAF